MRNDKLQGALDLLILKVLARGPEHGYGITVRVKQFSEEALQSRKDLFTPPCTAWSRRGGSARSGNLPRTIAEPNTTA